MKTKDTQTELLPKPENIIPMPRSIPQIVPIKFNSLERRQLRKLFRKTIDLKGFKLSTEIKKILFSRLPVLFLLFHAWVFTTNDLPIIDRRPWGAYLEEYISGVCRSHKVKSLDVRTSGNGPVVFTVIWSEELKDPATPLAGTLSKEGKK